PAMLPLDAAPVEPLIARSSATAAPDVEDLDLRGAAAARYDQAETAPRPDDAPSTVESGFSRTEAGVSRSDTPSDVRFRGPNIAAAEIRSAPPPKRSLFVPIAAALVLGGVIGAVAAGLLRNRTVPTVVKMTGAPSQMTASAAPSAETIPTEPPVVPVPSPAPPPTTTPDSPAASAPRVAAVDNQPAPADGT